MNELTWEQFALFLSTERRHSQKPSSVMAEHSRFLKMKRWFGSKEWSRANLRGFMGWLIEDGASKEYQNKFLSLAKNIDRYFDTGVTKNFRYHIVKMKRVKDVLTPEEIRAIAELEYPYKKYKTFLNARQRALIMILGTRGCRIGELLGLKWENVLESPIKHILLEETKNHDDREIPLNDELWALLQALPRSSEFVFNSSRGVALRSGEVNTDLKRRAAALGIKKNVYCHLLRHSFATTMKKMKVADSDICQIAGWKKPEMLMRYDSSELEHKASRLELHPLMQGTMSELDKTNKLVEEAKLWFDPGKHKIKPNIIGNKIVLEIEPI